MQFPKLMAVLLAIVSCANMASAQPKGVVSVGTVAAERRPVTQAVDYVGRIEAVERVDIRARVTGFLQEVLFKEGETIKAGSVLYKIEPESFEAAVQQARGALLQAQARFANATAQRERTEELARTAAASRALLDERVALEKGAQGDVVTADANLRTAVINAGYTQIIAPISGEVGRSKLTKGNVVGPDTGPLTVLVSRDPIYVVFPVSQREFLTIKSKEDRKAATDTLGVRVRFSDGTQYDQAGRINFVDVSVDRLTDTVLVRATLANPKGMLIDGQLVRVAVEADKPEDKVLVPQSALIADQQGIYVFVVENNKAVAKRLTLGGDWGSYAIVDAGLNGGEQVVVQGMETLRPGADVLASPVTPPPAGRS